MTEASLDSADAPDGGVRVENGCSVRLVSPVPEFDEVVRNGGDGAATVKALHDPRLQNAFESWIGGFMR
jgi:hypothetical protein